MGRLTMLRNGNGFWGGKKVTRFTFFGHQDPDFTTGSTMDSR